ncbi:MAG TPA: hypothetical protein VMB25_20605 [Bryobacteraceae bacterium]|nr:hypothetical protein [Bryobacteraceae bacterium]
MKTGMQRLLLFAVLLISSGPELSAQQAREADGAGLGSLSRGVYGRTSSGWKKMDLIMQSGFHTRHGASGFVGVMPGGVYEYTGPSAQQQFENQRPVFGIVTGPPNASAPGENLRDVVIVRMSSKKDHREVAIVHGGFASSRTGINSKDTVEAELTPISDHAYTLTPKKDLKPGEYLITTRAVYGARGYDFGVKR